MKSMARHHTPTPIDRMAQHLLNLQGCRLAVEEDLRSLPLPPEALFEAGFVLGAHAVLAPRERRLQAMLERLRTEEAS